MFTGTFKESTDNPVVLTSISNVGLRVVLDVIYTSSVNLTVDNVVQVLPTAHLLQLMEIVHQCADFMTLNISLENCLSFLQLAEKYDLEHCARAVDHYLINNFMEVANTAGFLELSKDSVCRYLADDGLMINGDELAAFRCAKKWLEAQPERTNEVYDVMKCVRFPKMPVSVLMDEILKDTLIDGNTVCRDLVMDAVRFHTNLYTQPLKTGPQYKPRGEIGLLLVGPGRRINSLFYTVEERPTELYLASFPEMRNLRSSYLETPFIVESLCSVQYGNFLFLFGVDGRSNCAVSWRYDASSDHWASIAGVPREAAVGCAAAAVNKQIILVGGMTIDKRSLYDIIPSNFQRTAYIYSIEENSWNPVADMPERLAYMAMTSVNDTAFCAGGITQGQSDSVVVDGSNSNLLHSYDVCSNTWTRLACMLNERSHFCLEAVREKLYAIGGYQVTRVQCKPIVPVSPQDPQFSTQSQIVVLNGQQTTSPQLSSIPCETEQPAPCVFKVSSSIFQVEDALRAATCFFFTIWPVVT